MKKHQLLILWMVTLGSMSFAASPTVSKSTPDFESATGSQGSQQIDWKEALPMLTPEEAQALGQIVDETIDEAFAEGFKQGVITWKPEAEYWKTVASLQPKVPDHFWDGFVWGSGNGVVVGILVSAAVVMSVAKVWK